MKAFEYGEGGWSAVDRPYLRVPRGHVAVKVKAFLLDDYSAWAAARGLPNVARWAFGNVVGGTGARVGEYVVALAENAAAEYVAAKTYFAVPPDPSSLTLIHAALVHSALDLLPRYAEIWVSGNDPRRPYLERLAEVSPRSRYGVILQSGALRGGAKAVALTRLFEVAGPGVVRVVETPKAKHVKLARPLEVGIKNLEEARPGEWAIVLL